MFHTIRWRLAASYAILILLAVTLMGTLALSFLQRYVSGQERGFLDANAQAVARQAVKFFTPPVRRVALGELAYASAFLGNARVRIMDAEKTVIADSGDQAQPDEFIWLVPSGLAEADVERHGGAPFIIPMPKTNNLNELLPMLRDLPLGTSQLVARRFLTPWGRSFDFESADEPQAPEASLQVPRTFISVTLPIDRGGNVLGYVELSSPLSLQRETIGTMGTLLLFSGFGAMLIAAAFGLLFGKRLSDPLAGLALAAQKMAGGDLSVRAGGARRDEIGALAGQFNAMAESLERNFHDLQTERDSLKRFVADASHELRTPITALSTFLELLQGHAADDPAARAEFLQESVNELKKLEWITKNLLDLSRLDAGIASLSFGTNDARDLMEEAASAHRSAAAEKGIRLELSFPGESFTLTCDRERIVMALSNLVSNSVKFTQAGGRVSLEAEAGGGTARFHVRDNGRGIEAEDLNRIFDRFSRGRNTAENGAGLGLAIVKSIAEAHGGSVAVESASGAGSVFTIVVPMEPKGG